MTRARPWISSLGVHVLIAGVLAFTLSHDGAHVVGGLGLFGATQTRSGTLVVQLDPIQAPPPRAPRLANEGLPVAQKKPQELPSEVKSVPREIDEPPADRETRGNSDTGPVGAPGQGGSSDAPSERIGNSDRTNALGLYLSKIHRRIQENLRPAGFVERRVRTDLRLFIQANGAVTKIEVRKSAGDRRLDLLAIDAVKRSQPFEPFGRDLPVDVPVIFNSR